MTHLIQDWKYPRTAKCFTGPNPGENIQSVLLQCVNNNRIPCNAKELERVGKTRFTVTVLSIVPGWAYAPYKKPQLGKPNVKDPNAKPLFELVRDGDVPSAVSLYSFRKAKSNFDREERDDSVHSKIHIGQVVSFFVQPFMFAPKETKGKDGSAVQTHVFPQDINSIPEFTVLSMRVMISNNETEGGFGLKLQQISLAGGVSLYSYHGPESLLLFPDSDDAAKQLGVARQAASPFIQNNLESKHVAFFSKAPKGAFISPAPVHPGYYRLLGPNGAELFPGVPCIDIAADTLLKYSNQPGVDDAITLMDFASAADALCLYVVSVRNFRSEVALSDYRGVPMVDANEFLRPVEFGPEFPSVFPFGHAIEGLDPLQIAVDPNPTLHSGAPPPCPDFALLAQGHTVARGYHVSIGTELAPDILSFVFNALGCPNPNSAAFQRLNYIERAKKRKAESEDE